ncbi:MAG: CBS domain-containing protein [Proteobacteria bacterium]|nr:CBS domain-containing protein [Pseudomonadota bacterium]
MDAKASNETSMINSNVVFVPQEMPMQEAVQIMIDKGISSLLVLDGEENVVGILTERDIVRKFTLLDMGDKLTRNVLTLMTRPVLFAHVKTLRADITRFHLEHKFRHFPVIQGNTTKKENIVGIVSITDLARQALSSDHPQSLGDTGSTKKAPLTVGIFSSNRGNTNVYIDIFKGMGFQAREIIDIHKYLTSKTIAQEAVVFDMDGFSDAKIHELIPVAVKSKAYLIFTTSNPSLIPAFKQFIKADHQEIAMKPLDISYISWVLTRKWQIQAP